LIDGTAQRAETAPERQSTTGQHITGFDYLRIAAAFGVVWIHGSDTHKTAMSLPPWTAFAVPCFWLMSAYLTQRSCRHDPMRSWPDLLVKRLRRLVPAYAGWTVVYLVLRLAKRRFISRTAFDIDWISVIFCGGASYQLYFVPALFCLSVLLAPLATARPERRLGVGTLLLGIGVVLLITGHHFGHGVQWPRGYEILGYLAGQAGYFPVGMALYCLLGEGSGARGLPLLWWGVLHLCLSTATLWLAFGSVLFVPVYSIAAFTFALLFRFHEAGAITRHVAPCAFGVFLSHAVFVEGLQVVARALSVDMSTFAATATLIASSFVCSATLCVLLKQLRALRWLVV